MAEQEPIEKTRIAKEARPWSGFFLGLVFGLALAVVLQQAGVWPLDRLLLFGSAGLFALIGILFGSAGRERVGAFSMTAPIVLAVALLAFGATGLARINDTGELHGGCTVQATSDIDSTVVTDTSRGDPFEIDPDGSLSWTATSPGPIQNHLWEIYVDIGGFPVVIADNEEPEPNSSGDLENAGEVADLTAYVEEVSNYAGVELLGVLLVGGEIEGDGGACDGFGFVRLVNDPLAGVIAQIAAVVGVLALIGLMVLVFNRTREVEMTPGETLGAETSAVAAAGATDEATGAGRVGAHEAGGEMTGAEGGTGRREAPSEETGGEDAGPPPPDEA